MIYIRRERPDSSTPKFVPATPAEVAAAHPKCGTCKWRHRSNLDGQSPMHDENIDPALDYCRHHSELTRETTS
jgi:hypothetical protein